MVFKGNKANNIDATWLAIDGADTYDMFHTPFDGYTKGLYAGAIAVVGPREAAIVAGERARMDEEVRESRIEGYAKRAKKELPLGERR